MRYLNIGEPNDKRQGWIGVDIQNHSDCVRDINKGLPFDDNSVDEIYSKYCLEHVNDIVFVMNEIHRVLRKGCKATIIVPTVYGDAGFQDPTHKVFFNNVSFNYFCLGDGERQSKHTGVKGFFKEISKNISNKNGGLIEIVLEKV